MRAMPSRTGNQALNKWLRFLWSSDCVSNESTLSAAGKVPDSTCRLKCRNGETRQAEHKPTHKETSRTGASRRAGRITRRDSWAGHKTESKSRGSNMPIRKRGSTYQVDVRLADGTRFRKTYPTLTIAEEAEKALTPNPTQRAIARHAVRNSRSKSSSTAPCAKPSRNVAAISSRVPSPRPTSGKSVRTSKVRPIR